MGDIIFTREYEQVNNLAEFKRFIDGKQVNSVENGKRKVVRLDVGIHKIFVKCMWTKSCMKQIQIKDGKTIRLSCGTNLKGFKQMFSWLFMFSKNTIYLKETN